MSDSNIEYATDDERNEFIQALCDLPHDARNADVRDKRFDTAAQLISEKAHNDGHDLSSIASKRKFVKDVCAKFESLSEFVATIQAGQPLEKADYLQYMGAMWRTVPENEIVWQHRNDPERLATILITRDFKPLRQEGRDIRYQPRRMRNLHNCT